MSGVAAEPAQAREAQVAQEAQAAPAVSRRLASFLYEAVLIFGVLVIVALVYGVATDQRHALQGSAGLRAVLFCVLGAYFVYFWSRHGQTLAMKTWHLRLLAPNGAPPGTARALARYLLAWLWFLPALATLHLSGLTGLGATSAVLTTGVLGYAGLACLRKDRQFLHDAICGTRLVTSRPSPRP